MEKEIIEFLEKVRDLSKPNHYTSTNPGRSDLTEFWRSPNDRYFHETSSILIRSYPDKTFKESTKNTVWLLFEDAEFGYYGARCGISELIGIYSSEEKANKANNGNYLMKEIELDNRVFWSNPYSK